MNTTTLSNEQRIVLETKSFFLSVPLRPHIDIEDGGHLVLISRNPTYHELFDLPVDVAEELITASMIISEAFKNLMMANGISIALFNYQKNGNWPLPNGETMPFHFHIYGRTKNAKKQKYGEALYFPNNMSGFYDDNKSLPETEIPKLINTISNILNTPKYSLYKPYFINIT